MPLAPLPIDDVLPEVLTALRENAALVLQAPTGAGKTTRLAPAILHAGLAGTKRIILLEPRRLAARAAAARMAEETGTVLGEEIGYQVRFERKATRATRILVLTEGVFLRMLQDDPLLEETSVVLFDEFHERSLNLDLSLALVRRVQAEVRPELKLVVMSATLTAESVAKYLDDCPVVTSQGRTFPVTMEYLLHDRQQPVAVAAARGVEQMLAQTTGDLLVFLPGIGEIRAVERELQAAAERHDLLLVELYGDLPLEKQRLALDQASQRRVILATNVAETSVTVAGVTGVVDTGLANVLRFNTLTGLNTLQAEKISQASADQRAGRAGRTSPGVCLRLWSERDHFARAKQTDPELARVELSSALLELLCWGETNLTAFPWFEPPPAMAVKAGVELLTLLGAVHAGKVTELGRAMVRLPLAPRLARMLLQGEALGQVEAVALAAALLSERDPLRSQRAPRGQRAAAHVSASDVVDRVALLEEFAGSGGRGSASAVLDAGAARYVLRARDQLLKLLTREARSAGGGAALATQAPDSAMGPNATQAQPATENTDEAIQRALLAGLPDRVARRREPGSPRAVMVGGRGVRLAEESAVTQHELFVCVELAEIGGPDALVRQASAIERDWLDAEQLTVEVQLEFDERREKVVALRRTKLVDLVLDEVPVALPKSGEVAELLAREATARLELATLLSDEDRELLARIAFLRTAMPELALPDVSVEQLGALLPTLCAGCHSFAELRRAPWRHLLTSQFEHTQLQSLERHAPQKIEVPSGSRIYLTYELGRPPVLAVRVQELFGMATTPRVAGGRVPVLLHLLGPNYRPQQITDDLASFWSNTYPQVKKDLKRRYPKHAWPDDPAHAKAENRAGGRRQK